MEDSDRAKLERLSFFRGLSEAAATHTSESADFSQDMAPVVGFRVHDNDGEIMLSIMLDFSSCKVAAELGQKTMMVMIDDLAPNSLDALDVFVAVKKRDLGITERYLADPPKE
jgi:hypothetical protein